MLIPLPCHKSQILMTDLGLSDSNKSGIKKRDSLLRELSQWKEEWYLLELNQGHMDFQSIALPPELRYLSANRCFSIAGAKLEIYSHPTKYSQGKVWKLTPINNLRNIFKTNTCHENSIPHPHHAICLFSEILLSLSFMEDHFLS